MSTVNRVPRVFVSYTHDSREHREMVLQFAQFLTETCGFDVNIDFWDLDRRRNWYQWAMEQITMADYVLVIASPVCKIVGDGRCGNESNRGMQSEITLLMELLHSDREVWQRRLLPVVLPGRSAAEIPLFLQPRTADHYVVQDFTITGAEDLLRTITAQVRYHRPAMNPAVVRLQPRGV
ncbi:SEFIR domain-containing protein [Nocardia sp. NBC_01388]|uniref:SEFIR domain-containing protein n=1 Tax=Nocardia sp. NBC_01388 TaxID=2903596 RepID=UPI0032544AFB